MSLLFAFLNVNDMLIRVGKVVLTAEEFFVMEDFNPDIYDENVFFLF